MDFEFEELMKCKREDPDLALLFAVNEKFILWNLFNTCFLQIYVMLSLPIQNKSKYERLPDVSQLYPMAVGGIRLARSGEDQLRLNEINEVVTTEMAKWKWFGRGENVTGTDA